MIVAGLLAIVLELRLQFLEPCPHSLEIELKWIKLVVNDSRLHATVAVAST
jgi:hypothetical protein